MSELTLAQANTIITAALAHSKTAGYKPMGIAVLDASGNLKAFASEDGASMFRFDIARAKAWGAVGMGASSRVLMQRAKDNPNFFVSLSAPVVARGMKTKRFVLPACWRRSCRTAKNPGAFFERGWCRGQSSQPSQPSRPPVPNSHKRCILVRHTTMAATKATAQMCH
jgi:hypothetical protein